MTNIKSAMIMGALAVCGGFDPFGSRLNCETLPIPGTCRNPKHGEPGSRMESVRSHHKAVQRKKRARKNKRGF